MTTNEINQRYVDINLSHLQNGTYILDAHLGSGKTTTLQTLRNKKVLYITFRNQLINQVSQRFDWIKGHITNNNDYRLPFQLAEIESLAINYKSLKKLTRAERIHWEYVIIDEPFGVWCDSSTYEPDIENEDEFQFILQTTPKVIYMGGDFPEFLTNEINEIAQKRNEEIGQSVETFKYSYKTDIGIPIHFVYGKKGIDDKNMFIDMQLRKRRERRKLLDETPFFIIEGEETEEDIYKREEEEDLLNTKGVLITTEIADGVKAIAEMWQNSYPELNIQCIYAENVKDFPNYNDLLKGLSDPQHYSDIDMLIVSPTWTTGINVVNEFDVVVGDYVGNKKMPLHPRDIFQAMHRERNPKLFVIQLRLGRPPEQYETLPDFPNDNTDLQGFRDACETLGFEISKYNKRLPDGSIKPRDDMSGLYKRAIEVVRDNVFARTIRTQELWKMFKNSGATVNNWEDEYNKLTEWERKKYDYENLPNWQLTKMKDRLTGELPHTKDSQWHLEKAKELLSLNEHTEVLTEEEFYIYDYGYIETNIKRRKELDCSTKPDESYCEAITFVKTLITISKIMKERPITERYLNAEMVFKNKEFIDWIKANKERLQKLLSSYMNKPVPTFSTPNKKQLEWFEEILRKHFYYVELKVKTAIAGAEKDAIAEIGKTKFKNWKTNYSKEHPKEGYYKLRDYLFIELMNDNLKWNDLGRKTKNYLKTFDHIIIREIPEDYQKLRNPHY